MNKIIALNQCLTILRVINYMYILKYGLEKNLDEWVFYFDYINENLRLLPPEYRE